MIEDIGGVTSQLIKLAIDGTVFNQKIIANNIANSSTPGFKSGISNFEDELSALALRLADKNNDQSSSAQLKQIESELNAGGYLATSTDEKVQLDMEMARMSENMVRYQALLEGSSKYGQIIKMAIRQEAIR